MSHQQARARNTIRDSQNSGSPSRAAPAIVIPGRTRTDAAAPGIVDGGTASPDAIGGDKVGGIAVPVVFEVIRGIAVERLQVAGDVRRFNPRLGRPLVYQ